MLFIAPRTSHASTIGSMTIRTTRSAICPESVQKGSWLCESSKGSRKGATRQISPCVTMV